ncbi:MAG: phenylalanine--tRNA ligase subunit beta [Bacteroidia bacterium]|nr:phenylalanine--tRNA ligase subunit beta [Bacteroidia bacterium]
MQLSRNWLSEYVTLPADHNDLDRILTDVGLEVEFIEDRAAALNGFVVGSVLTCEKHPNADKLSVCTVHDGEAVSTVVCGAPNVAAGQKIIFAKVGTVVPSGGFTIEKRKLRGVESAGMICSTAELGLDDDHSGIAVLPADALPGMPIAEYLGINDVLIGIGITPNRGDALSHIGVARDIAAATRQPLRLPQVQEPTIEDAADFRIDIDDAELCVRYSGALIEGVRIGDSPEWLAARLRAADIRPINNVVDVTNYILMEIGQPMHAFDRAKLQGSGIHVRTSRDGETISTLDGEQRSLPEGALLICDEQAAVAVAGVMGGLDSAVTSGTTSILLESACFNPSSVRRTARRLGLSTDSSYRFERGTDPNITMWALRRAAALIADIAGGTVRGLYDAYPVPVEPKRITLRPQRCCDILGIDLPAEEQRTILESLSFTLYDNADASFDCIVPTFRNDISREIDLIEEIARIHGYDNIPVPTRISLNVGDQFDAQALSQRFRALWLGFGFDEILSSSLVPHAHAGLGGANVVSVRNPVSKERPALRGSLLSSLLEAVDHNIRNGNASLRLFEMGRIYFTTDDAFNERDMLAAIITGSAQERSWYAGSRDSDFFDLKGAVETFISALHLEKDTKFCYDRTSTLSPAALHIEVKGRYIGQAVAVSDHILASFGIEQPVMYAEFEMDAFLEVLTEQQSYTAVAKFPAVSRDLAVIVQETVTVDALSNCIAASGAANLRDWRVVDVFRHESLGAGRKSMAFSMTFRADDRTLKDDEIQAAVQTVLDALRRDHQAELRI